MVALSHAKPVSTPITAPQAYYDNKIICRKTHGFLPRVSHWLANINHQKVNLKACSHPQVVTKWHTLPKIAIAKELCAPYFLFKFIELSIKLKVPWG